MNGSALQPQFQQHVLPSNDFSDQSFGQSYPQNGLDPGFGQDSSHINGPQEGQQYQSDPLGLGANLPDFRQQQGFDAKQEQSYEHSFMLDPQLDPPQQNHINPADIMSDMSSPQNMNPTPPSLMPPDAHSSGPASPITNPGQQWSPHHSRHTSLDPSAAFTNGHQSAEWSGMLTGSQFQNHRRAPSEHSDVSSSVAPSPYMAQQDTFDTFDQNPSPMLNAQQDELYHGGLGIESFTLSEPQQQRHSPRHSPFVSPRMSPQPGMGLAQENNFMPLSQANNSFNGGPGSELFTSNQGDIFPPFRPEESLGSNDMGQAAQMVPPEINVEYAPSTRQQGFLEPPRYEQSDMDALSPPDRGDFGLVPF